MSEQDKCSQEQTPSLEQQLHRLCVVIEAQTKAISEFATATAQMQCAMVELQSELAASVLNDGDEGEEGRNVYLDDDFDGLD